MAQLSETTGAIAYSSSLMDTIAAGYKNSADYLKNSYQKLEAYRDTAAGPKEYEGKAKEGLEETLNKLIEHIKVLESICLCAQEYVINAKEEAIAADTGISREMQASV